MKTKITKIKTTIYVVSLLLISFSHFSFGSTIKQKIQNNIDSKAGVNPIDRFRLKEEICSKIKFLDESSNRIKSSMLDLTASFKIHVQKFINQRSTPISLENAKIEMQIISSYLEEIQSISKIQKKIKLGLKEFQKNTCDVTKEEIKEVYIIDRLLSKLMNSIKKHVIRTERPFKRNLDNKIKSVKMLRNNK